MKNITIEKLPETIRINFEDAGSPGYSALIIPKRETSEYFREFYLINNDTGAALYMFGVEVQDDNQAAEVVLLNVNEYLELMDD